MNRKRDKLFFAVILLLIISSVTVSSQDDRRSRRNRQRAERIEARTDSLPAVSDSMQAVLDSTARADSAARRDSLDMLGKSSLDMPAFTTARDSIIEDFTDGKRMIYYYGEVTVKYGDMELTADYMEYDLQTKTVFARGTKDSTGVITGMPTMTQAGKTYTMEELRYNFDSGKARITNMVTQESFLRT